MKVVFIQSEKVVKLKFLSRPLLTKKNALIL